MNQSNNQPHITLLLLTHNEEERIKSNFSWLKKCPTINEIVAVDDLSTDHTVALLKKQNSKSLVVKTYSRGLDGNFSAQRNFAITHTSNDWILWLDPDEIPDQTIIDFLNHFNFSQNSVFAFKRSDIFLGNTLKHGETSANTFVRLFNKKHGGFTGMVHEVWRTQQPIIVRKDLTIHHQSSTDLNHFFAKINQYSSLRAKELFQQHHPFRLSELIFFPVLKFIQNYYLRLGFLDGTAGIIIALGMSFHSFLSRAKLWHSYSQ